MDEMQEIIQDFIVETKELIENLDRDLVALEKTATDEDSKELLNSIFRAAHTIKGASGFLGFTQLVDTCHKTETLFNKLRHGEKEVSPHVMDVILEAVDIIKILLSKVENKDEDEYPLEEILGKLDDILEVKDDEQPEKSAPIRDKTKEEITSPLEPEEQATRKKEVKGDKTIRIDTDRLDDVMNLLGELVLERNRLLRIVKGFEEKYEDDDDVIPLSENGARMDLLTTDLQMAVMKTRMQPVKKVFSKFPRMVRDLARASGKEIELQLEGEDTELDKSVIEEIGDPLVHLIRNSVDHGIGLPDEREKNGKNRQGTLTLSAYHEGDNIVIEVEDDGRGIDSEKIKVKAVEKGLISKAEAEVFSKKEVLNLVFAPGFSTAEKVTDISGRGVGMDVVKTNITNLNGMVDIESELGIGSRFILKLPLTVAIIDALMVGVGEEIFAMPLASVIETIRVTKEEIKTISDKEVISLRDGVLSLVRLSNEFNIEATEDLDRSYVVVIGLAEKRVGVVVERLLGQEEVVIKPLGDYLSNIDGVSGATVTGDGKVVLILDISILIQKQIDAKSLMASSAN
jgi:two-component system chemotaxis sensor kinase CheA